MDERILRLVLARGIPDALIRDLGAVPVVKYPRRYGVRRRLTPNLYETLKLLASEGLTNRRLGERLGISEDDARMRVNRLLAYFDVRNRCELVALCYRQRIV